MNGGLHSAKSGKKDEFYTQMVDIEKELSNYKEHFKDKVVYCNADLHSTSNFVEYFKTNFNNLKLKKLIASNYNDKGLTEIYILEKQSNSKEFIERVFVGESDGDFRGEENIELLKQSDIVVTNPPFSLFREYIAQLIEYKKDFLILGNINATAYKEIFPLIKNNEVWLGFSNDVVMEFQIPNHYDEYSRIDDSGNKYKKVGGICWFTNLTHNKRYNSLVLEKNYQLENYPKYDNYNAIEVNRVANIPNDYIGVMGVPISFLAKYNPEQFEILGTQRWGKSKELLEVYIGEKNPPETDKKATINGKEIFTRIFIKHKK